MKNCKCGNPEAVGIRKNDGPEISYCLRCIAVEFPEYMALIDKRYSRHYLKLGA